MPPTDNDNVTWLTQEAHDRLSKELDELVAGRSRWPRRSTTAAKRAT